MYPRFGLTLMVTHACNMRCSYCYTGAKFLRSMPEEVGGRAIDRALASLLPGGTLELGFFGGEPLLEAGLVQRFIAYARGRSGERGVALQTCLTTNGTQTHTDAWSVMTSPELDLAVSFDGLPRIHDRHRRFADGGQSSAAVLRTMRRLLDARKEFRPVMVVRPDSVTRMPEGVGFLREMGVRHVELALDIWADWTPPDARDLETAIALCARLWRDALPEFGMNWFDEKAARLAGLSIGATARCGFGDGEIAVAPSGRLYPCERLIGDDSDGNPMRLDGNALDGDDFLQATLRGARAATSSEEACGACAVKAACNTTCRCSNYVRTGDVAAPDRLLCILNQACLREVANTLSEMSPAARAAREKEVR